VADERAVVLGPGYAEDSNRTHVAAVRASAVAQCGGGEEARAPGIQPRRVAAGSQPSVDPGGCRRSEGWITPADQKDG
jgi:hypothetical protein